MHSTFTEIICFIFDMHSIPVRFQKHCLYAVTTTCTQVEIDIHTIYLYVDGIQSVCCGYVSSTKHKKENNKLHSQTHEFEREKRHTSLNVNGNTINRFHEIPVHSAFDTVQHNRQKSICQTSPTANDAK